MSQDLKNTLNLPQTGFPMRGNLVQREPVRIDHWEKLNLYEKIQSKNAAGPSFILHDGPPFTNGDLHLGHALNKTLKDTILRFKWMQGYNAPYIPGWDSHGLPIEHKVSRELQDAGRTDYTPLEVRKACAQFADKYRKIQSEQFKRLGVLADWSMNTGRFILNTKPQNSKRLPVLSNKVSSTAARSRCTGRFPVPPP